ncbi:MAG: hypothetical protein HYU25_06000 [Candidatus Rokubacteria bacterium]|nr:hypothetical protein [Candidatus Rokubacteria bacterium]
MKGVTLPTETVFVMEMSLIIKSSAIRAFCWTSARPAPNRYVAYLLEREEDRGHEQPDHRHRRQQLGRRVPAFVAHLVTGPARPAWNVGGLREARVAQR